MLLIGTWHHKVPAGVYTHTENMSPAAPSLHWRTGIHVPPDHCCCLPNKHQVAIEMSAGAMVVEGVGELGAAPPKAHMQLAALPPCSQMHVYVSTWVWGQARNKLSQPAGTVHNLYPPVCTSPLTYLVCHYCVCSCLYHR
jgi:hypothetical protein